MGEGGDKQAGGQEYESPREPNERREESCKESS